MIKRIIKNAYLYTDKYKKQLCDILINQDGIISEIGSFSEQGDAEIINADYHYVIPSFVDLSCFCNENYPYREDLISLTHAAIAGGYGTILLMPERDALRETPFYINKLNSQIEENAIVHIIPASPITKGMNGEQSTEYDALSKSGAKAFYDNGYNPNMLTSLPNLFSKLKAVEKTAIITTYPDIKALPEANNNSSYYCDLITSAAVSASYLTGCKIHILNPCTTFSLDLISTAKKQGVNVTCSCSPQYFIFSSEDYAFYGNNINVSPALANNKSKEMMSKAIGDGVIDCITSDHTPLSKQEKDNGFPGIIGLQTTFSAVTTYLLSQNIINIDDLLNLLVYSPASVLGINNDICIGAKASLNIVDFKEEYIVSDSTIQSKSKNSPFIGMTLRGRVLHNINYN